MARPKKAVRTLDNYFAAQPVKVKPQPSEIIIIDSDSDCDNRPKRRRTTSISSGEIEFVEPPPIKHSESDPEIYIEPTIDISFDDDWTMGDDERAPDLDDDPIGCDDQQQQCPICQKYLTSVTASASCQESISSTLTIVRTLKLMSMVVWTTALRVP